VTCCPAIDRPEREIAVVALEEEWSLRYFLPAILRVETHPYVRLLQLMQELRLSPKSMDHPDALRVSTPLPQEEVPSAHHMEDEGTAKLIGEDDVMSHESGLLLHRPQGATIPTALPYTEEALAQLIDPPEEQTLRVGVTLLIHRMDPDGVEV